jgi:hypothetical protein
MVSRDLLLGSFLFVVFVFLYFLYFSLNPPSSLSLSFFTHRGTCTRRPGILFRSGRHLERCLGS